MKMKTTIPLFRFVTRFSRGVFGSMSLGDELKKKAEAGDAVARYKLGVMYADGDGVQQDSAEAANPDISHPT
jgi:TPR repeat protein